MEEFLKEFLMTIINPVGHPLLDEMFKGIREDSENFNLNLYGDLHLILSQKALHPQLSDGVLKGFVMGIMYTHNLHTHPKLMESLKKLLEEYKLQRSKLDNEKIIDFLKKKQELNNVH